MPSGDKKSVKKFVLSYCGRLVSSIILLWVQTTYGDDVVTFTAVLGQGDDL
jgi:argininosuccinate synthase